MRKKFFLLLSFILVASCQNNSSKPAKAKPVKSHSNIRIDSTQKPVKFEINPADNQVYNPSVVENLPKYPDGIVKFNAFLKRNYIVPKEVIRDKGKASAIFVTFVIEKDGKISDGKILHDFGYSSGKELLRVIKLSSDWIPATKDGKAVRCLYSIPYYCL